MKTKLENTNSFAQIIVEAENEAEIAVITRLRRSQNSKGINGVKISLENDQNSTTIAAKIVIEID